MGPIGKWFIYLGLLFVAIGVLLTFVSRIPGLDRLGNLPGDIHKEGPNGSFHFPWVTCLLLSVVLTILFNLINRFFR